MDIVVNRSGIPLSKVKCRMLALDLDGTLLNSNHEVSLHNIKILNTVEQQGTLVILVSGRMHQSMLPISQQIGLQNPIISYNGGMVKHPKTGDVSFHLPVPRSLAVRLIEYCQKANLHLNFGWNDQLYVRQRNHWSDLYESRTGVSAEATGDLLKLPEAEPTKMQVLAEPEKIPNLLKQFEETFGSDLYITRTQPEYIEFMNPRVSKGLAITSLANELGIPISETMAFGDGFNDESMLQVAGHSVAMENAEEEIKHICNYITASNDQDGVALAIEQLILV